MQMWVDLMNQEYDPGPEPIDAARENKTEQLTK
jgi:hypothetical protein